MKNKRSILLIAILALIGALFLNGTICSSDIRGYCFLGRYADEVLQPILTALMALGVVTAFTFFISNTIFKKWLIFTCTWIILDVIWVMNVPVRSGTFLDVIPAEKESVSIFMGGAFILISILMFIIMSVRERSRD